MRTVTPDEQPVLGDTLASRCIDDRPSSARHISGARAPMLPPEVTDSLDFAPLAHRQDVGLGVGKWRFVEGSFTLAHRCPEIDDPLARRAAGQIHRVEPRFQDFRVEPAVGIRRQPKPLSRQIAWNVERSRLLIADESGTSVPGQSADFREVRRAGGQIGGDTINLRSVKVNRKVGVLGREANERDSDGCAVDHPRFVGQRVEDRRVGDDLVQHLCDSVRPESN